MWLWFRLICLSISVLVVLPQQTRAAPKNSNKKLVKVEKMHIYVSKSLFKTSEIKNPERIWNMACGFLGEAMTIGKGPWGFGIISSFDCDIGRSDLKDLKENTWILGVEQTKKEIHIKVERPKFDKNGGFDGTQVLAQSVFPYSKTALGYLNQPDFIDLIAVDLFDQLPVSIRLTEKNYDHKNKVIKGRKPYMTDSEMVPEPPHQLAIYTLKHQGNKGIWRPHQIGAALLTELKGKKKRLHRKLKISPEITPDWDIKGRIPKDLNEKFVWAYNEKGRHAYETVIRPKIAKTHETLSGDMESSFLARSARALGDFFKDSIAGGYIGVRYGLQVAETPFFQDSSFFGLVYEARSGLLEGFRFYYDIWPTLEEEIPGEEGIGEFGGSRMILGYGFGLDLDNVFTRIEVTPKVGMWSFKFIYPLSAETKLEYVIKDAISWGIEGGLERSTDWYVLKGWASKDIAIQVVQIGANEITTTRAGLDVVFVPPGLWFLEDTFNFSFLAFSFYENILYSREVTGEDESIDEIETAQTYVGGGLALSW